MLLLGPPFAGPFIGLLGPFIGFSADPVGDRLLTGLPVLALIASHPAYPAPVDRCPSAAGVLLWFHLGGGHIC